MPDRSKLANRFDRASEAILLAIVVLSPWAFGTVEAWARLLLTIGVVSLTVLSMLEGWTTGRIRIGLGSPGLALAGLGLLGLAQALVDPSNLLAHPSSSAGLLAMAPSQVLGPEATVVSPPPPVLSCNVESSRETSSAILLAWVLFMAVANLRHPATFGRFAWALTINSVLLALFAMIQGLTWNGKIYWVRESPQEHGWYAGGPFICHSHLAAYLNLGLGFALAALLNRSNRPSSGRGSRLVAAYAVGVIVAGVIASQSRNGTMSMLIATVVVFGFLGRRTFRAGTAVMVVVALIPLLLLAVGNSTAFQRMATVLDSGTKGYVVRFEIWKAGWDAWLARPTIGSGLGTFAVAAAPHFNRDHGVVFTHAENEPIHLLAESGVLGFAVALAGVLAVAGLVMKALRVSTDREKPLVLGATFGLVAIFVQSFGDFCLHIPAVGMTATALVALLVRVSRVPQDATGPLVVRSRILDLLLVVGSSALLGSAWIQAKAEAALAGSGLPLAGPTTMPNNASPGLADLQKMQVSLERALQIRPDWAEGHLRLGSTLLAEYEIEISRWIAEESELAASKTDAGEDPAGTPPHSPMADPLWLLSLTHQGKVQVADLIEQEPVKRFLIPATRHFLEARRCSPSWALPHTYLASLHYLIAGGEPATAHLARARDRAGASGAVLRLSSQVAVQVGDLESAIKAWRRLLEIDQGNAQEIAEVAGATLTPEALCDRVLARGSDTARFAEWLYDDPEDQPAYSLFMKAALERLPAESGLSASDRLQIEATARYALGQYDKARKQMESALMLDSGQNEWREQLIGWLLDRGDFEAARRQAQIGRRISPSRTSFLFALEEANEAIARGGPRPKTIDQLSPLQNPPSD